jgi:quercetin dioxygenase-like cupin family protein
MSAELLASAQPLWFIDSLAYIHVSGEETGGAYSLSELCAPEGSMPPLHVHHRDDETFYVLQGELRLFVGDRELVLSVGQAAVAPRGTPHTYSVQDSDARFLVVNSPAGFDSSSRPWRTRPRGTSCRPPTGPPTRQRSLERQPSTASRSWDPPGCCRLSSEQGSLDVRSLPRGRPVVASRL